MSELMAQSSWLEEYVPHNSWQQQQLTRFKQRGVPTRKEEAWKYTSLAFLEKSHFTPVMTSEALTQAPSALPDSISLVFVNGKYQAALSDIRQLPKEVTFKLTLPTEEFDVQRYPFAVLNSALLTEGLYLDIPKQVQITQPIHLIYINTHAPDSMMSYRNVIHVGEHAAVTIVEEYTYEQADRYLTNVVTQITVADQARLTHYKIQREAINAIHLATFFVTQAEQAYVHLYSFSHGSQLARDDVQIKQVGPGAESYLDGFYHPQYDGQHIDHHLQVDHRAEQGKSEMIYKGILHKRSRAVFNGKVYVHPGAQHIQAHQANHNLLLSADAEVDSKPELEIYADDVKCTHGATIGQLDEETLFYLQSRGIEKPVALHMLTRAFAQEIFGKIENVVIREYLQERINNGYAI